MPVPRLPGVIRAALDASPWGITDPVFAPFTITYPANTIASLTAYWVTATGPLLAFEREHPRSCLRVRFEDLAQGRQARERITSFLGLVGAAVRPIPGSLGEPQPRSPDTELTTDPPVDLIPPRCWRKPMTCSSNLTTRQWQQITHNDSGVMSGSSRGSTDLGLLKAGLAAVGLAAILPKAGGPASAATAASALGGSAGHHHHRGRRYRVPAVTAALGSLSGLVIDRAGNPVVTDFGDNVGRVVPARSGRFYGKAMRAGNIYIVAGNGHRRFTGDGGPAFAAGLGPQGVAVDAAGNLVTPTREQPGWGGGRRATGTFYGQAMMAGQIYTVAATASQAARVTAGRPPWPSCRVPAGVAVTGSGGLLIADADNFRVRLVAETSRDVLRAEDDDRDIYQAGGRRHRGHLR